MFSKKKNTPQLHLLNSRENGGSRGSRNYEWFPAEKSYPRECIFSNIDIASMAMHATISMDILNVTRVGKELI